MGGIALLLIDTHAHLDHSRESVASQLAAAAAAGVDLIIQSGTDLESSRSAVALASAHPGVFATIGIHPHDAGASGAGDLDELRLLGMDPRVVAVGRRVWISIGIAPRVTGREGIRGPDRFGP